MRAVVALGLGVVLVGGVRGGDTAGAEETMRAMITAVNDISILLENIRDDASADAALPGLEKGAQRVKDLEQKMASYQLSDEERKKLQESFRPEVAKAVTRLYAATRQAGLRAPKKALQIQAALNKAT